MVTNRDVLAINTASESRALKNSFAINRPLAHELQKSNKANFPITQMASRAPYQNPEFFNRGTSVLLINIQLYTTLQPAKLLAIHESTIAEGNPTVAKTSQGCHPVQGMSCLLITKLKTCNTDRLEDSCASSKSPETTSLSSLSSAASKPLNRKFNTNSSFEIRGKAPPRKYLD